MGCGRLIAACFHVFAIHKQADDCQDRFNHGLCRNHTIDFPEMIQEDYARNKKYGISQYSDN